MTPSTNPFGKFATNFASENFDGRFAVNRRGPGGPRWSGAALALALVVAGSAVGCKQGEHERCETASDCGSGLDCLGITAGSGTCQPIGGAATGGKAGGGGGVSGAGGFGGDADGGSAGAGGNSSVAGSSGAGGNGGMGGAGGTATTNNTGGTAGAAALDGGATDASDAAIEGTTPDASDDRAAASAG